MAPSEVLQAVESAAPTTPDKELEHEVNNNNEEFETPKKGGSPPAARPKYVAPNVLYKPTRPMMEEMDIAKQVENPGAAPNTILVKRVADTSTAALTVLTDYLGQVDPQVKVGLHEQMVKSTAASGYKILVKNCDGTFAYQNLAQTKSVELVNQLANISQPETSKVRKLTPALNKQPLLHVVTQEHPSGVTGDCYLASPLEMARIKVNSGLKKLVNSENPTATFVEMFGPPGCDIITPFMADLRKMYILGAPPQNAAKANCAYSFASTAANLSVNEHGDNLLFHLVKNNNPQLLRMVLDEFSRQTTFGDERGATAGKIIHPGDLPKGFTCERFTAGLAWMRWKEEKAPKWVWVRGTEAEKEKEEEKSGKPKIPDPAKHLSRGLQEEAENMLSVGVWKLQEFGAWEKVQPADAERFGLNMRTQLKPHLCLADVARIRANTSIFHCALESEASECMKVLLAML